MVIYEITGSLTIPQWCLRILLYWVMTPCSLLFQSSRQNSARDMEKTGSWQTFINA